MTDRIHSLTVVFETDLRTDDVDSLVQAIKQMRGVLGVDLHVADITTHMAETRARKELGEKLISIVYPD